MNVVFGVYLREKCIDSRKTMDDPHAVRAGPLIEDNAAATTEIKTARCHMMPPPQYVCVMGSPALRTQRPVCTVKFVKSFATWQHRFDVDSNFLSYPAPCLWYSVAQNVVMSCVGGSD